MATHSSILAWRIPWTKEHICIYIHIIPWTEKPGGLQSVGSQRIGHDTHSVKCSL